MTTDASAERALLARFSAPVGPGLELLGRVAEFFRARGETLYLVGGAVRDAARAAPGERLELRDLDFTTEADALALAPELAAGLGASVTLHQAFLTAELWGPAGGRVDLATTRREHYATPAALPEVSRGTLRDDLARRDFTVNAMAMRLAPQAEPALADPFAGLADLAAGRLRILHQRSFVDDPTRIFRGVRFEERLGLAFDRQTELRARRAIGEGVLAALSADRLRQELRLTFAQPGDVAARLERLGDLGALAALAPGLTAAGVRERLAAAAEARRWLEAQASDPPKVDAEALHCLLLCADLAPERRRAVLERVGFQGSPLARLVGASGRLAAAAGELAETGLAPHRADEILRALTGEELVALLAAAEPAGAARRWASRWLRELRGFELTLTGDDLLARGATPGPAVGEALRRTRQARLDGRLGAGEELAFALRLAEGVGPRGASSGAGGEGS